MNNSEPINLVFAFDKNYATYAAIAIFSCVLHSNSNLRIYCVTTPEVTNEIDLVKKLAAKFRFELKHIRVAEGMLTHWTPKQHFGLAAYIRLLLPEIIPEKKVIYLDSDILVEDDLLALYSVDLKEYSIAGALDPFGASTTQAKLRKKDHYINSGVLLLDLEQLKNEQFTKQAMTVFAEKEQELTWADQCLINIYFEDNIKILDSKWNFLVYQQQLKPTDFVDLVQTRKNKILHFVGNTKPWHRWANQTLLEYYWNYAKKAPWINFKITECQTVNQHLAFSNRLMEQGKLADALTIKDKIIKYYMNKA
jgi:lipopolysaccharide biosynthesis glycosyltransferase